MTTRIERLPGNHTLSPDEIRAMERRIDAFLQGMVGVNPVGLTGVEGNWKWEVTGVSNGVNMLRLTR